MGNDRMNISVGTDIIEVARIKEAMKEEKFKNKVFTNNEIKYCEEKRGDIKYQHYAARFASKEAVFKAVSQWLENKYDLQWKDVEILNDNNGKPKVRIINKKIEKVEIDISISHIKEYATATAIAIKT